MHKTPKKVGLFLRKKDKNVNRRDAIFHHLSIQILPDKCNREGGNVALTALVYLAS